MNAQLFTMLKKDIDTALKFHSVTNIHAGREYLKFCRVGKILKADIAETVKLANAYAVQQRQQLGTHRRCSITC